MQLQLNESSSQVKVKTSLIWVCYVIVNSLSSFENLIIFTLCYLQKQDSRLNRCQNKDHEWSHKWYEDNKDVCVGKIICGTCEWFKKVILEIDSLIYDLYLFPFF